MNERFKNLKSISDIVDTMIKGLNKEWIEINMTTFGELHDGVCFGCAATNTLCELMQESFNDNTIYDRTNKFNYGITEIELNTFESSIDCLRCGNLIGFLEYLKLIEHLFNFKLPTLEEIEYIQELPKLYTSNWKNYIYLLYNLTT